MIPVRRFAKGLIVSALVLSLVLTSLFLIMNTDHDCESHSCQTCRRIEVAFNILRSVLSVTAIILCVRLLTRFNKEKESYCTGRACFAPSIPILLKVKLNN